MNRTSKSLAILISLALSGASLPLPALAAVARGAAVRVAPQAVSMPLPAVGGASVSGISLLAPAAGLTPALSRLALPAVSQAPVLAEPAAAPAAVQPVAAAAAQPAAPAAAAPSGAQQDRTLLGRLKRAVAEKLGVFDGTRSVPAQAAADLSIAPTQPSLSLPDWRKATALELESFFLSIETNYGPEDWKRELHKLDWEALKRKTRKDFVKVQSVREYYRLIGSVLAALKDAHVSLQLPSDYQKSLPLQFSYAEGQAFISYIDREALPKDRFPFSVGDVLVSFDGTDPEALRAELAPRMSVGNEVTDRDYIAHFYGLRSEARGHDVPASDSVKLVIRSQDGERAYEVPWSKYGTPIEGGEHFGEKQYRELARTLDFAESVPAAKPERKNDLLSQVGEQFHKLINVSVQDHTAVADLNAYAEKHGAKASGEGRPFALGDREPHYPLPEGFKEFKLPGLLRPFTSLLSNNMLAGVFERDGQRIGYLRVSSYMPNVPQVAFLLLRYYVGRFAKEADKVFIDQTFNPGGMVAAVDWQVSLFFEKPYDFKPLRFAVKPTQQWLRTYSDLRDMMTHPSMAGLFSAEEMAAYLKEFDENHEKVLTAYNERRKLSEPVSMLVVSRFVEDLYLRGVTQSPWFKLLSLVPGIKQLFERVPFLGPVGLAINHLCFSGGDAFPAIMKDNGRADIVGVNTAGAGGSVGQFSNDVVNTFKYSLTQSLMVLSQGGYVENVGVAPHKTVEPTIEDHRDGHQNVLERFLQALGW